MSEIFGGVKKHTGVILMSLADCWWRHIGIMKMAALCCILGDTLPYSYDEFVFRDCESSVLSRPLSYYFGKLNIVSQSAWFDWQYSRYHENYFWDLISDNFLLRELWTHYSFYVTNTNTFYFDSCSPVTCWTKGHTLRPVIGFVPSSEVWTWDV